MSLDIRVAVKTEKGEIVKGVTVKVTGSQSGVWEGQVSDEDGVYRARDKINTYTGHTFRCEVTQPPYARRQSKPIDVMVQNDSIDAVIVTVPVACWRFWLDSLARRIWNTIRLRNTGFEEIAGDTRFGLSQACFVLAFGCLALGWCVSYVIAPLTGADFTSGGNLATGVIGVAIGMIIWIPASSMIGRRLGTIDPGGSSQYFRTVALAAAPLLVSVVGPFLPSAWAALVPIVPWYVATTMLGVHQGSNSPRTPPRWSSLVFALAAPLLMFAGMALVNGVVIAR